MPCKHKLLDLLYSFWTYSLLQIFLKEKNKKRFSEQENVNINISSKYKNIWNHETETMIYIYTQEQHLFQINIFYYCHFW